MKAKPTTPAERFRPFDLLIAVETPDDLAYLWTLFNTPLTHVADHLRCDALPFNARGIKQHEVDSMWEILDMKAQQFHLKKDGDIA
jgi:hypothetical protein